MRWLALLSLVVACSSDDHEIIVDYDGAAACTSDMPCSPGFTCTTGTYRCECEQHGNLTTCEPLACPATPVEDGTPCSEDGLVCDQDFEFSGYRCTAPENVFVHCLGGTADSRCPATEPTVGGVCCWSPIGFDLQPCDFGGNRYRCDDSGHWVAEP